MIYVLLVPLLPLLAALVIGVAGRSLRERSAKVGGAAVVAAFLGALVTLVAVSSNGPISVRFYEPASGTSLGFPVGDRKSTRLNSSHGYISYAVFCLKKKTPDRQFSLSSSTDLPARLRIAVVF